MTKEKYLLFFFALSHTFCVSKAAKIYSLLLGYFIEGGNFLLSPYCLSSQRQQHFSLSSSAIFSKVVTLCSLLLGIFSNVATLCFLLPIVFIPSENLFFSFLVPLSIFPLPTGRTLRPKPSNSL